MSKLKSSIEAFLQLRVFLRLISDVFGIWDTVTHRGGAHCEPYIRVRMPSITERFLLDWIEDLEQGIAELSRLPAGSRRRQLLADLIESARGLAEMARFELPQEAVCRFSSYDPGRMITSLIDIKTLCANTREALAS
ncbi:hypothetical protein [Dyella japonica]|uniref:Uncharacterized protein n=1 Tax=Dyella japonica TaxID=231455 RepID=A0ABV2JPB5_9GAMM